MISNIGLTLDGHMDFSKLNKKKKENLRPDGNMVFSKVMNEEK
jgi:hypothetical protein